MALTKQQIAQRIAQELRDGYYVNLGIGIPTLVANYVPKGISVVFQSENGLLGMGPFPYEDEVDADMINAGKQTVTTLPGSSIFDSLRIPKILWLDKLTPLEVLKIMTKETELVKIEKKNIVLGHIMHNFKYEFL